MKLKFINDSASDPSGFTPPKSFPINFTVRPCTSAIFGLPGNIKRGMKKKIILINVSP
jgi:hypothetical protein